MREQLADNQQSSNLKPVLKKNDRFILGAVVFAALIGGLLLYSTRNRDEPTNQGGLISVPEMPAVPGGKK